jgi:RNA polymerase sigma-70 factor (ECF subfamily)
MPVSWRLSAGEVDRDAVVIVQQEDNDGRVARSLVRLRVSEGRIVGITDYWYCPWMLPAAQTVLINDHA